MIRRLLTVTAALWLAGCGAAERGPAEGGAPALWEVTAPGGQSGWLFGTVHALPPDGVEWRTPAFDRAFADADLLVVEIAELADTAASFEEFRKRAYTPGLLDLPLRVEPGERELLAGLLDKADADAGDFDDMENWAVAMVLSAAIREGDPENGVDRYLLGRGKPVLGLESFAGQFAAFDTLSPTDQHDLLMVIAREARENGGAELTRAWLAGDLSTLERHADSGLLAVPSLRRTLLTGRNVRWARQVAPLVEQGREPFIAVGAGHMLGAEGLPALLAERGFTVRRIQ